MLSPDVIVAQLQCLAEGILQNLLGARGERNMAGRGLRALPDDLLDLLAHRFEGDVHGLKGLGGNAFALMDKS